MATFYLEEQIALQEVELPYLMLHPSLHKSSTLYFNAQLQLNTENVTHSIMYIHTFHLFTSIPKDFLGTITDHCLFGGSMMEKEHEKT
jgi:hypothetical protein